MAVFDYTQNCDLQICKCGLPPRLQRTNEEPVSHYELIWTVSDAAREVLM